MKFRIACQGKTVKNSGADASAKSVNAAKKALDITRRCDTWGCWRRHPRLLVKTSRLAVYPTLLARRSKLRLAGVLTSARNESGESAITWPKPRSVSGNAGSKCANRLARINRPGRASASLCCLTADASKSGLTGQGAGPLPERAAMTPHGGNPNCMSSTSLTRMAAR